MKALICPSFKFLFVFGNGEQVVQLPRRLHVESQRNQLADGCYTCKLLDESRFNIQFSQPDHRFFCKVKDDSEAVFPDRKPENRLLFKQHFAEPSSTVLVIIPLWNKFHFCNAIH